MMEMKVAREYLKVPNSESGNLTEAEVCMMNRASRWVVFLAVFQMLMAILSGNILHWILAAIFVPFGIVGAIRRRPKMLVAHFVYSIFQYIFSLIGVVYLILYCDECSWPVYLVAFVIILIQAIGMRSSRIMIALVKLQQAPTPLPMVVELQQQELPSQQIDFQQPAPPTPQQPEEEQQQQPQQQPQYPMFYAIPMPYGQQPQQGQPGMVPQFYPIPLGYPLLHPQQQPVVVPEASVYPAVYKQ